MIAISQDALHDALSAVTRASLKNSLNASFSLVRLDAGADGRLSLSCFNGETAARAIVQVACDEDFSVSVDALTLKAVVETLAGEIRLTGEGTSLILHSQSNRTTLRVVDEPLPVIGEESVRSLTTLAGHTFRSLARVLPFAFADESRPTLQVLHLTLEKETLTALAADGFSAGCVRENAQAIAEPISLSLPLNFARLLATLVEDRDSLRVETAGDNRTLFQITNAENSKDLTLATVMAAGAFPSAQIGDLIEQARRDSVAHLDVQQTSLMQTIRMVQAMGTQNTFIKASGGAVKVASSETETGQARNILEGTAGGQDTSVWLSAAFLKRAAESCKGEIAIWLADGKKPVLVEAGGLTAIIMPVLVEGNKDPFPEDEAIAIEMPAMVAA